MGMRQGDNDIDRETREAETYADAAQRALAVHAVTKWNKLMERSGARHKPGWSPMVTRPSLFTEISEGRLEDQSASPVTSGAKPDE